MQHTHTHTHTQTLIHSLSFPTAPTAPRNLVVSNMTAFTVSLDWDEPQPPNGIIDNYIIRYYEDSTPNNITLYSDTVLETTAAVYDLKAHTSYTFLVSAMTVAEGPDAQVSATTDQSSMFCSLCSISRV